MQTDNGFEFTNRPSYRQTDRLTAFEMIAQPPGIQVKHIEPYTPRHNGKVERSRREDRKRFYNTRSFYSFDDFAGRLAARKNRSNRLPMRPLRYLSPMAFLLIHSVQHV